MKPFACAMDQVITGLEICYRIWCIREGSGSNKDSRKDDIIESDDIRPPCHSRHAKEVARISRRVGGCYMSLVFHITALMRRNFQFAL